jgi:serine O-acetyltransferase
MQTSTAPLVETVWTALRDDATTASTVEPLLARYLRHIILDRASFADGLAVLLAEKLFAGDPSGSDTLAITREAMAFDPTIVACAAADLSASFARNPAYPDHLTAYAYAKGFHALESYRVAHALWTAGRERLALYVQGRMTDRFAIDIHPAARMGSGIFLDHATGIVIGETAVVGDNVSMLQNVTLGGTGKDTGDRHPKIGNGVLLSAGAKVLGNITVGDNARIGAGSVVLRPIPADATAAGVPARVVRMNVGDVPGMSMEHDFIMDFQI